MRALLLAAALLSGCALPKIRYQLDLGFVKQKYATALAPAQGSRSRGVTDISANEDRYMTGTVHVSGIPTSARIHSDDGSTVVVLKQITRDDFVVPIGTDLTEAQYALYLAGRLHLRVETQAGALYVRLNAKNAVYR